MQLHSIKALLHQNPDKLLHLILPDGDLIPVNFHVTEVGHVAKNFVDCGGTTRQSSLVQLQVWIGNDAEHRLTAGKLAGILDLAKDLIPSDDLEVEVEYEACAISQYPVAAVEAESDHFKVTLASKHTDCLAKEACGIEAAGCCGDAGCGT
jgi:hypothetical protein